MEFQDASGIAKVLWKIGSINNSTIAILGTFCYSSLFRKMFPPSIEKEVTNYYERLMNLTNLK